MPDRYTIKPTLLESAQVVIQYNLLYSKSAQVVIQYNPLYSKVPGLLYNGICFTRTSPGCYTMEPALLERAQVVIQYNPLLVESMQYLNCMVQIHVHFLRICAPPVLLSFLFTECNWPCMTCAEGMPDMCTSCYDGWVDDGANSCEREYLLWSSHTWYLLNHCDCADDCVNHVLHCNHYSLTNHKCECAHFIQDNPLG